MTHPNGAQTRVAFPQILTLENYQMTLYSVVRSQGYAACTWFVLWILIGKFTFLSLFLAVTLEAFDNRWVGLGRVWGGKGEETGCNARGV